MYSSPGNTNNTKSNRTLNSRIVSAGKMSQCQKYLLNINGRGRPKLKAR